MTPTTSTISQDTDLLDFLQQLAKVPAENRTEAITALNIALYGILTGITIGESRRK